MTPAADERAGDALTGQLLGGRYRVIRKLGEGGAGVVYEAQHEELGRQVAIKVLGAAWAYDAAAVERFQREARAASNIGHRHIVDVYDLGKLDDGRPYLVMQRLHGESLDGLIERQVRLTAERVASIIAQAASALDAVHRKSIVHRDIKPENLFLARPESGGEPEIKLLDFGLAAIASPDSKQSRLTRQGTVHGTPHYMAPEATGDDLPDHRADIYSLAVVAFELLTGKVPFDSPNPLRILTLKHERDAPSLQEATGDVYPEPIEEVFRRALHRNPDMRYDSAGELAEALTRAAAGLPAPAPRAETADPRAPTHTTITPTTPPMRRTPLIVAGVLLLAATLGSVAMIAMSGEAEETEPHAETAAAAPREPAGPSPELAAQPTATPEPDPTTTESEAEAAEPEGAPTEPDPAPRARTRPRRSGAPDRTAPATAEAPTAALAGEAAAEAEPALAETHRQRAAELTREGTSAMLQGRIPDAIRMFRDATNANPRHAAAWRGLGLANERLGRGPEAARAYERYLRVSPNAPDAAEVRRRLDGLR